MSDRDGWERRRHMRQDRRGSYAQLTLEPEGKTVWGTLYGRVTPLLVPSVFAHALPANSQVLIQFEGSWGMRRRRAVGYLNPIWEARFHSVPCG